MADTIKTNFRDFGRWGGVVNSDLAFGWRQGDIASEPHFFLDIKSCIFLTFQKKAFTTFKIFAWENPGDPPKFGLCHLRRLDLLKEKKSKPGGGDSAEFLCNLRDHTLEWRTLPIACDLVKTYLKECEEKGYQEIPRISWESWSQEFRLLNPDGSVFEPEELESVAD